MASLIPEPGVLQLWELRLSPGYYFPECREQLRNACCFCVDQRKHLRWGHLVPPLFNSCLFFSYNISIYAKYVHDMCVPVTHNLFMHRNLFNQVSISMWVPTPSECWWNSQAGACYHYLLSKLSSPNTLAFLVMQPRCEHLKSLIVNEQEFKSESRDLVWSHEKSSHYLQGGQAEVAQAGTTQPHAKPRSWLLSPPFFWIPLVFYSSFPPLPLFLLLFPSHLCCAPGL